MAHFTYLSTSPISIDDLGTTHGTIDVYGVDGVVKNTTIDLVEFKHSFATDVDMLLVAPDGQHNLAFMSDTGGTGSLSQKDFGFSDLGASLTTLADGGLYLPTDVGASETAANWGLSIPTINHGGLTTFASAFGGIDGNGEWSLYVHDDMGGDTGSIKGWNLTVSTNFASAKLVGEMGDDVIQVLTSNQNADDGVFQINDRGSVAFRNAYSFYVDGGDGNDLILLDREADIVVGGKGRDSIHAGGNTDYINVTAYGDEAGEVYDGGAGDDWLFHEGTETLNLRDDLVQGIEHLYLHQGGKAQVTAAQASSFVDIFGAMDPAHLDVLEVTMGASTSVDMSAVAFVNFTNGGERIVIKGDGDAEFIAGSHVNDVIKAGGGDDQIQTNFGFDTIDGGKGSDTVDYSNRMATVQVKLNGSHKVKVKLGGVVEDSIKNVENVTGGQSADKLKGDKFANVIEGSRGADSVWGGAGQDKFVFATTIDAADHIKDFSHADDTIVLWGGVFAAFNKTGGIKAKAFVANDVGHDAHTAKQKLIYDKADHSLWYDADGNGAGAAVEIAIFDNKPNNLDFHDFQIV